MSATPASNISAQVAATEWLKRIDKAGVAGDIKAIVDEFLPYAWLRDVFCLSWDLQSRHGQDGLLRYFSEPCVVDGKQVPRILKAGLHNFALDEKNSIPSPRTFLFPGAEPDGAIECAFTFSMTNPNAVGKGYLRLVKGLSAQGDSEWKALSMMLSLHELAGFEERTIRPHGIYYDTKFNTRLTWDDIRAQEIKAIEDDPTVLIVGASVCGLMCAARFRRLGLRTLVIEKLARVGDVWRDRYTNLTLHTANHANTLLYEPIQPSTPKYIPRLKVASMLEAYATSQDIHIWLETTFLPRATYDPDTKRWSVQVRRVSPEDRQTTSVSLSPKYIVMATGFGEPYTPDIKGLDSGVFKGTWYHSNKHRSGSHAQGKKVVVVGASNAAGDLCQDFVRLGAESITMVQRSATTVCSIKAVEEVFQEIFKEQDGVLPYTIEDVDHYLASAPPRMMLQLAADPHVGLTHRMKEIDKDLHAGLEKAGFKLTWCLNPGGPEYGLLGFLLERRGSGSMIDEGVCRDIIAGRVKVKSGVEIEEIVEEGVAFRDGSKIEADIIAFATGHKPVLDLINALFDPEIAKKLPRSVLDIEEGPDAELSGAFRPCQQPGLWIAAGNFQMARYYSKYVGLQILAEEHGLK